MRSMLQSGQPPRKAYGTSGVCPSRDAALECTRALVPRAYFVLLCVHFTSTFLKEIFPFDPRRL
jgi:hypothetical protein